MAVNVADLIATLRLDTANFVHGTRQASQEIEHTTGKLGALGKAAIAAFSIVAIKQVVDFGAAMFRVGMESEAFQRKYEAVFGNNTATLDTWVADHHEAFGKAEDEVQGYLAQIGNLLVGMGNTADQAGEQATKILEVAGAWSAWSGGQISVQDASDKLVKGMLGQTRGLVELGLKVTEQEVNARMAAEGLDALTGAEASRAQQQVMWQLIQEKSTTAVGAYGEAMDGAYGSSMDLAAAMDEMKDAIGKMVVELAPALTTIAGLIGSVADAFANIRWSNATSNAEQLSNMWGTVLAGSAEDAAAMAATLKDNIVAIAQLMGLQAAQKTEYLVTHVDEMRDTYQQAANAVLELAAAFAFLYRAPAPEPSNIAFPFTPVLPKGYGTKWAEVIISEMAKKWESIPSKNFGSKWAFDAIASVDEALNTLPALIAAHGGDVEEAAADLFALIAKQEQFAKDIRTLTDQGLDEIVSALTSGPITQEVMDAARALATGEGNAYADELNYRMAWATTNAAWLASPEHANWQAVSDAYAAVAAAIGQAYQDTLSPYLLVNPPSPGGTSGGTPSGGYVPMTVPSGGRAGTGGGSGGTTVNVHVAGSLLTDKDLARIVEDQLIRASRRGATSEVF